MSITLDELEQLIDTGQLFPIWMFNERRVLEKDIDELLRVYQRVQKKAN